MTTYDEIWSEFLTNCKTSDINLPNTDEKRYSMIKSAIRHYNNRLNDTLKCDDTAETVNRQLTDNELIIIAHYIRLSFFENELINFTTIWTPFTKEIGVRTIKEQMSALSSLVTMENNLIEDLILNSSTDYL
jgi:hypothetical protein